MVVRQRGDRTQIAVLEDGILVEHYVTKASSTSYAGNVYLGRVQNVLPSMEAAFVDIGKGRNAVLYAGEVNWDAAGLEGRARTHRARAEVRRQHRRAGHQGPDRAQGRPADQPGQPARALPRVRAERLDDRHQPQAAGHRAGAAEGHPAPDRAGRRRRDHPHRRRGRERGGAHPRRRAAQGAVGGDPAQGGADQVRAHAAVRRAGPGAAGRPGRLQRGLHQAGRVRRRRLGDDQPVRRPRRAGPAAAAGAVDRRRRRVRTTCASTSSCSRRWTARSGCPPAARWSSTAPRR